MYYFRGFSSSLLSYDPKKSEWKLTKYSNPNIYATCNESIYPFGTLNWYFYEDTCRQILIEPEKIVAKNVYKLPISFNVMKIMNSAVQMEHGGYYLIDSNIFPH